MWPISGHQETVARGSIDVVGDRLVGLGLQADADARHFIQTFCERPLVPIPHLVVAGAQRVREPVVARPKPHVRGSRLLHELQRANEGLPSLLPFLLVRIGEGAELELAAPEAVGAQPLDAEARHLGGQLEALRNGEVGHVAVVEPAPSRREVPDPDGELRVEGESLQVLQKPLGRPPDGLVAKIGERVHERSSFIGARGAPARTWPVCFLRRCRAGCCGWAR